MLLFLIIMRNNAVDVYCLEYQQKSFKYKKKKTIKLNTIILLYKSTVDSGYLKH